MQDKQVQPSLLEAVVQSSPIETGLLRCPYCHDAVRTGTPCTKCTAVYHPDCLSDMAYTCVIPGCNHPLGKKLEVAMLEKKIEQAKFVFPTFLRNEVIAFDGSEKYVYEGQACNIDRALEYDSIWADPHIIKYKRTEKKRKEFLFARIFSSKTAKERIMVKDTKVWHFKGHHKCFVNDKGTTCSGHKYYLDYRAALLRTARAQGIELSHELFEAVFKPIDEMLAAKWKQYKALPS